MLIQLPDHETLYQALDAREVAYDGRVFVCVISTGVFCRLSCSARKPKSQNCRFVESVAECIEGGFRACKRCRPLIQQAAGDPLIVSLLEMLEVEPDRRWGEDDLRGLGIDPAMVRRSFKRQFGITFLELARLGRLRRGFESAVVDPDSQAYGNHRDGVNGADKPPRASFASTTEFYNLLAKLLGKSPGNPTVNCALKADWIDTPMGTMIAVADHHALHLLEFIERKALSTELKKLSLLYSGDIGLGRYTAIDQIEAELKSYFAGIEASFTVPLAQHASPFTCQVWDALQEIPAGQTCSYSQLAQAVGRPAAVRAVARANGANPIAIVVPCHRVLGADGSLTGYGGGLWRKQRLIELERQYANSD